LPDDKRSKIESSLENFKNNLCKYSEYFRDQRYLCENQKAGEISINIKFLYDFRELLHEITPEIHQVNKSTAPSLLQLFDAHRLPAAQFLREEAQVPRLQAFARASSNQRNPSMRASCRSGKTTGATPPTMPMGCAWSRRRR
jgi:hypothetical protein